MNNDSTENVTGILRLPIILVFVLCSILPIVCIVVGLPPVICVAGVIVSTFVTVVIYCVYIAIPTKRLTRYVAEISKGDFGLVCPQVNKNSEVYAIAQNIDVFISETLNTLILQLKMEVLHTQDSSNNFLTEVQEAVTTASRISLGADFIKSRVENLENLLLDSLSENAQIKDSVTEYGQLVNNQNDAICHTGTILNAIVEGLNKSIDELVEKKKMTNEIMQYTSSCTEKVQKTVDSVTKISEGIVLIKDTIRIVASVASQTNLLAMNAAIEAAHAGDAGLGFAVVANEIRSLAETTAKQVKAITNSLKGVTNLIHDAVASSEETGQAFTTINNQIAAFVSIFDEVTQHYTSLAGKNNEIGNDFTGIQQAARKIADEMSVICNKVDSNIVHLNSIRSCNDEIKGIVKRNTSEALQLSRSQSPIYQNAVDNAKHLEAIRKRIDVFRLANVPIEMWKSDKTELWSVITATFDHLDWTVMLLDFLHGTSDEVRRFLKKNTTRFDSWLYGSFGVKYAETNCMQEIVRLDGCIHDKALVLARLCDAGKEQEATIEFSELLELSRQMVIQLNELKKDIIYRKINPGIDRSAGSDKSQAIVPTDSFTTAKSNPNTIPVEPVTRDTAAALVPVEFGSITTTDPDDTEIEELEDL